MLAEGIGTYSGKAYQRLTQSQKDENDKEWYKYQVQLFSARAFTSNTTVGFGDISEFRRKKVNYDLYNNVVNLTDFEYVTHPYGANMGELPANLTNRDILSSKIKVLLGMEMKRPFEWSVVATDENAITRKGEEELGRIRDFVISQIMTPIQQQTELKYQAQLKNKDLTDDERSKIQQQIAQEIDAATPDAVRMYMERQHKDPAEVMADQLMKYIIQKENIQFKFNKGWKHFNIAGEEIYWVGIVNGEPICLTVNPIYFDYDKSPDHDFIEQAQWAVCEYRMTPDEVVRFFGDELTDTQVDDIYHKYPFGTTQIMADDFTFSPLQNIEGHTIRVIHCEWKSLRKVGFLSYVDKDGQLKETVVDENYGKRLDKKNGDLAITWKWIPELHEGYKIGNEIYCYLRPVQGQYKDLDNLYDCKLRYIGAACDNLNSQVTSIVDRIKTYQYFYNILFYKLELLIASDKGKKLLMNINMIPRSAGIDTTQWMYYLDANSVSFFNPSEEGNKDNQQQKNFEVIDLSLATEIDRYIKLLAYIDERCGSSIGVTKEMEGFFGTDAAVTNVKQSIIQSSHILEPYFKLHNDVKRNVLTSLLECAKVAYTINKPRKLNFCLDDLSLQMLDIDTDLLDNSTYSLFVTDSSKSYEAKQMVEQLAHAAIQNQAIDLSDVIKVVRSGNVQEAEEILQASEERKRNMDIQQQTAKTNAEAQEAEKNRQFQRELWQEQEKQIILKEEERRKTELLKTAEYAMGFDQNKDENNNGEPDVLEVAKHGLDIKMHNDKMDLEKKNQNLDERKQKLEEEKLKHQKEKDKKELELKKKQINKPRK
jgi:hypothetical protein